jgi:hypothetical protein
MGIEQTNSSGETTNVFQKKIYKCFEWWDGISIPKDQKPLTNIK